MPSCRYCVTLPMCVVYGLVLSFLSSQMRSRQFDDFPSNWSTAKEIEFIVVRQPDPVEDLAIDFTTVDVVCRNNQTFLELDVGATWSEASIPEGTMFDDYEFSVKDLQSIFVETESVDMKLQRIALDSSEEPSLNLKFQVCSRAGACTLHMYMYYSTMYMYYSAMYMVHWIIEVPYLPSVF